MRDDIRRTSSILLLALLLVAFTGVSAGSGETVLKIGTPNVIKSPSVVGDTFMSLFAHLSNPPLMKMDPSGLVVGQTAESYEVSEDGKTWRFQIRDDLYWSDGEKLTPEDVRFTFEYLGEKYPPAGWIKDTVEEIAVEGDAVVFALNKPYSRLNLEFATYNILPEHIWKDVEDPMVHVDEGPVVGFGPFVISRTDLAAGVLYFEKNPYWEGEAAKIGGVEIHMYANMDVLSMALMKGDVDAYYKYAGTYPYANLAALESAGGFDVVETDNTGLIFLGLDLREDPMSDPAFREALASAIDYQEILKLDALGYGSVPSRGFVPPSMGYFKETEKLSYDAEEARRLLEEAGYRDVDGDGFLETPDGKMIDLTFLTRADYQRITELLQEYLADIGIKTEMKMVDQSTWITMKDDYQYDLTVTRTTPWGMMMHANWGTGYFDSRRTGEGVLHVLDDPSFHQICDEILAATTEGELEELAHQVQDYYAENLPGIALYWNKVETPYNSRWQGWVSDPLYGIYNLDNFLNVERA